MTQKLPLKSVESPVLVSHFALYKSNHFAACFMPLSSVKVLTETFKAFSDHTLFQSRAMLHIKKIFFDNLRNRIKYSLCSGSRTQEY